MEDFSRVSPSEWKIMAVVWDKSPLSANEIVDALAGVEDWNHRTVKTLINRLVNKKVLGFEARGKTYFYFPQVAREACVEQESRSFLGRVFGGRPRNMLAYLVERTEMSGDEISELKKMLDEKQSRENDRRENR